MSDVVVVGGGIVGCACAFELARAGARVALLEYGRTGMQATNAAAGMLAPLTETHQPGAMLDFGVRALRAYPTLVDDLQRSCGFDLELRLQGILKVAFTPAAEETLRQRFAWQRERGFALEWLDGGLCRELEPRISPRIRAGILSPDEGSVSNQQVALALARAATTHGARVVEDHPVTGFETSGDRVTAVRGSQTSFACDAVVIAAGARSGQLAAKLGAEVPVIPVRGQMIALGGMRPPIRHVVWGPHGYLVPRANGLVFAGATVERVGFRRRTTRAGVRGLRSMAAALVPQLRAAAQQFEWAGLRPGTADGAPIVGRLPGWGNGFIATGHYRNGILLGPLTGSVVARGILTGDWAGVPIEFSPARFGQPAASVTAGRPT